MLHERIRHKRLYCSECNLLYDNEEEHRNLCNGTKFKFVNKIRTLPQQFGTNNESFTSIHLVKKAFNNFLTQWELVNRTDILDIHNFFGFYNDDILNFIEEQLKKLKALKIQFRLQVLFNRIDNELIVENIGYFSTKTYYISNINYWNQILLKMMNQIENQLLEYSVNGSNWIIKKIIRLDIHIGKYKATYGSCLKNDLPTRLKNKQALICIKNKDEKCFLYSICAKLFPTVKRYQQSRPQYYSKYFEKFNLKNISFPFDIKYLDKFEKQNKHLNMRINIYGYNELDFKHPEIFPVRISKFKAKNTIDLLLYENHFYLIKNFNRFCGRKDLCLRHFCRNCLTGFRSKSRLDTHLESCSVYSPTRIIMPSDGDSIHFANYENQLGNLKIFKLLI